MIVPPPAHRRMYVDDGLRAKLAPVLAAGRGVSADLARMGALLESARAEFYILSTPHSFPVEKYRWVGRALPRRL